MKTYNDFANTYVNKDADLKTLILGVWGYGPEDFEAGEATKWAVMQLVMMFEDECIGDVHNPGSLPKLYEQLEFMSGDVEDRAFELTKDESERGYYLMMAYILETTFSLNNALLPEAAIGGAKIEDRSLLVQGVQIFDSWL